ncbi:endoglucanase E-4-like [Saccoglossus kowalevskii]
MEMMKWIFVISGLFLCTNGNSYNYCEVLESSLLFYEAQRSGVMTEKTKERLPWKKDSAVNDVGQNGEDLSGGYYDAGDHLKIVLPMAHTLTIVAWGYLRYPDAYDACRQTENVKDMLRWGADYLLKVYPEVNVLYFQVGDINLDHSVWIRAEDMTMDRPALKANIEYTACDVAAETAAALAAINIVFKDDDPVYAHTCLSKSEELYNYAMSHSKAGLGSAPVYQNPVYTDELVWAMLWLYKATGIDSYLSQAIQRYDAYNIALPNYDSFSWKNKNPGIGVMLARIIGTDISSSYKVDVKVFVNRWLYDVPRTPLKLAYVADWGTLRAAASTSFIALMMAEMGTKPRIYREFATQQINYMLGDAGRSYVVGLGKNPPQRAHHRDGACPLDTKCGWAKCFTSDPNPIVLTGGLVGGPDITDAFDDNRANYAQTEVALEYNAAFQSAVAGLKHLELINELPTRY